MRLHRFIAALLVVGATAPALSGCGPKAHLATPEGFAALDDQDDYSYRAASPEGVVIGVRREAHKPKGNLDFWAGAVDQTLRRASYEPEGKAVDVKSAGGVVGRQMRYTRQGGGRIYRFWATVFLTPSKVFVVEAGGDAERFSGGTEAAVTKAIAGISIE